MAGYYYPAPVDPMGSFIAGRRDAQNERIADQRMMLERLRAQLEIARLESARQAQQQDREERKRQFDVKAKQAEKQLELREQKQKALEAPAPALSDWRAVSPNEKPLAAPQQTQQPQQTQPQPQQVFTADDGVTTTQSTPEPAPAPQPAQQVPFEAAPEAPVAPVPFAIDPDAEASLAGTLDEEPETDEFAAPPPTEEDPLFQ